jgi:hypothetical protein
MSGAQAYVEETRYDAVTAHEDATAVLCDRLDPDALPLSMVPQVYASLVRIHNLVGGAVTRLARKVEESRAWQHAGDRSPVEYLARTQGVSRGQAKEALETSKRLWGLPETEAAVRRGELSEAQASTIADAAAANPAAEHALLGESKNKSVGELRDAARRLKAAADPDPEATYRRIHENRYLRRYCDAEGAYNLALRTTPDAGAKIDAALQPAVDRSFADARRQGRRESLEAYAADALPEVVCNRRDSAAPSRGQESKVIALVDHQALRRGHTQGAETCELAGVGAVPVSTVRSMLADAFLSVVVTDGVDVYNVAHAGRQVSAHQRSALQARGYRCEIPGCGVRHNLQVDHISGWAFTRRTALDDLAWECPHHHYLKTHCGYRLEGSPRKRRWLDAQGNIAAADHNPHPGPGPPGTKPPLEPSLFTGTGAA